MSFGKKPYGNPMNGLICRGWPRRNGAFMSEYHTAEKKYPQGAEKPEWGTATTFIRYAGRIHREFRSLLHSAQGVESEILADNGYRIGMELDAAVKMLREYRKLPLDLEGTPRLYARVLTYLEECGGELCQRSLCEFLSKCQAGKSFYNCELILLRAFLVIASVSCYQKEKNESCLQVVMKLTDLDFESIYFMFSGVETIFLTETAGVYLHCDGKTRRLYHERLRLLAKRKGMDELAAAREVIAAANKENTHIGAILKPYRGAAPKLYFYFLTVLTLVLTALYAILCGAGPFSLLLIPFAVVPIYTFSKEFLPPFFAKTGEKILPKLSSGEKLASTKTLVSVATLLFGEEKDAAIYDKIEDFYLTNPGENIRFAVLGDLGECEKRTSDGDAAIIAYAKDRIAALNAKYGDHFALFIRERRRSVSEDAYIGWERKRGGVLELCRFLRGLKTSIRVFTGNREFLRNVEYLVTLDADTNLYIGAVNELVGAMLHPENHPVVDEKRGIVISGHAVIQPRMITSLESASRSTFARLTGGAGGLDVYAGTSSDVYQQVFGEGIFCGKGILDVDVFLKVCDGFFPNERILSHDLVEGNLLRSALGSDIVLSDSTPKNALSYYTRMHRWCRGDLQVMPYLAKTVRNTEGKRIRNPMSKLSKFKIFDNFLRGLTPLSSLLVMLLAFIFGIRTAAITALFAFLYILSPIVTQFFTGLYYRNLGTAARRFYSVTLPHFLDTVAYAFFRASALVYEAYLFADASIRTLYRFFVSRRNFLNWTTASEGDRRNQGEIDDYVAKMWPSAVAGLVFLCIPAAFTHVLGLLWLIFPFSMWGLSQEKRSSVYVPEKVKEELREYTHAAWLYFHDLVGEQTNFLPPDNYQISPVERVAMRTSPTNIGLYLLSVLAARDCDFITSDELLRYAKGTLRSLSRMLTWNGHFYNWYDVRTLEVIGEPFISTVDSGNFVTSLVAFCEGMKEYVGECPALLDCVYAYEKLAFSADFRALYDPLRRLFKIGYDVKTAKFSDSCYDTFMSEARTASYFATATLAVPREHYFTMSRRVISSGGEIGIASWSGTAFEYFMPALLLPTAKNSLSDEALAFAYKMQRRSGISKEVRGRRQMVFGISESGYFGFDYEMNYQYRAFGVGKLALDPRIAGGAVISPYSSFLMLERDPARIAGNLKRLRALGVYGKYGFFEAIDFDSSRVGDGYAVIRSYMAHHLGMSIVASVNAVRSGIFRKRFMRAPVMRASRELLSEKIPVSARSLSQKKRTKMPDPAPRFTGSEGKGIPKYEYNLIYPELHLLSNNKTKIIASSSGHVELSDGSDILCASDFDRYSLGGGLRVYAEIDGRVFSAFPLSEEPEGFTGTFDFIMKSDMVEYVSHHSDGKHSYAFCVRFSVFPDREIYEISCKVSGNYRRAHTFLYFQPVMDKRGSFEAHKSFSNLFLESAFFPDESVLLFARRPRNDKKPEKLLGITVFPEPEKNGFDTMRDKLLPLMASEKDYAALAAGKLSGSAGAVIIPALAMRSGTLAAKKGSASFYIGYSTDKDDLLYVLTKCRKKDGTLSRKYAMGDILNLQYCAAGLNKSAAAMERFLLRGMIFGVQSPQARTEPELHIDKNCLWKHSLSGENKIVLAKFTSENEEQKRRLFDLIRLFKYMCIRGIRYDFIILYTENDHYHAPCRKTIEGLIRRAGCENFVSWAGGIFLIAATSMDTAELSSMECLSCAVFDLSVPPEVTAGTNKFYVPISAETTRLLKRGFSATIREVAPPELSPVCEVCGGFFHENGFVTEKPHGRIPWAHIVASENFGTVLTENSLGFTYARNSGMKKLTPHEADNMREDSGERLILRIYDRFDSESYEDYDLVASSKYVNFAFGRAEYTGQVEGIWYQITVGILEKHDVKRISVRLESGGAQAVHAEVCFMVRPCIGERRDMTSLYRFRKDDRAIYISRLTDGGMGRGRIAVMALEAAQLYTNYTEFLCAGKLFDGTADAATLAVEVTPGDTFETDFYLAAYFSERQLDFLRHLCFSGKPQMYEINRERLYGVSIKTSDVLFDEIVNKWTLYQTLYARIYARCGFYQVSGAYGFRDQLQDALSLLSVMPDTAKVLILRAAAHQYEDGSVQHWWHPGTGMGIMTRCSDDFLWLPYVASEYVRVTGDRTILDTEIAYLHSPPLAKGEDERYEKAEIGSVREPLLFHLLRAAENGMRTGEHGLPLIGSCDWNDGMNLVGKAGKGESVWLAFFTVLVLHRLIPILQDSGMEEFCKKYKGKIGLLLHAAKQNAFDGKWYLRGFYDDGTVLGGHEREECKIDMIPQAFAMLAARELSIGDEHAKMGMKAVYDILFDRQHALVRLLYPPFHQDEQSPGYIKGYVPGIRENGGQYTHAAVWAALGFFAAEENDKGAELLFAINPALHGSHPVLSDAYKIEPYVLAGDVYANPDHMGRGGWSWYTGSASWYRKAALETLCGYLEEGDGFYLRPHLSRRFSRFVLTVSKRNTDYRIHVQPGRAGIQIDGQSIISQDTGSFKFMFDGGRHEVEFDVELPFEKT